MNKNRYLLTLSLLLACLQAFAQSDDHYTMFMYNKLLYNPGYTGSREATSINATLRRQWTGIQNAPTNATIAVDGPLGSYMRPVRKIAVGISLGSQTVAFEKSSNVRAYLAYRKQLKKSLLSVGMSAGATFYSVNYTSIFNNYDPAFSQNINNALLPNAGLGVYWSSDKFYMGASVPNIIQNRYGKDQDTSTSKQLRAYYLAGGYSFALSEDFALLPQVLLRYGMNGLYRLPFNADINMSFTAYKRFMLGLTYRTNGSVVAIMHVQASKRLNIGYAYEYMMKGLNSYTGGTHELVLGFDLIHDDYQLLTPRFIRKF